MDAAGELIGVLSRRNGSWKPELVLATPTQATRG
jgi:hypothetical protein